MWIVNNQQKKEPKDPLRIPLDFEETLAAMLQVPPKPDDKKPPAKKADGKKKPIPKGSK